MDPKTDKVLTWIAREALKAPLPENWKIWYVAFAFAFRSVDMHPWYLVVGHCSDPIHFGDTHACLRTNYASIPLFQCVLVAILEQTVAHTKCEGRS